MRERSMMNREDGPGFKSKAGAVTAISFPYKVIFILIPAFITCQLTFAQDLHFSQWFNSPLTTNPANTGFIPDADYRIGANYRNQYVNILSVPYKTISI